MGKPSARLGDFHVCPKKTGKVPHVGGVIIQGSASVFVGGLPAAKVGDNLICVGPVDTITKGSGSVTINGKPAARVGDGTAHGGRIVVGNPTVLIGDKAWRGPNEATLPVPPATRDEAMKRLDQAASKVAAARAGGEAPPASPYTTEDKLYVVAGGLSETFIVRVMKSKYAGDSGHIGNVPKGATTTKYWTTTFTQLEHADSDPELVTRAVGITYEPGSEYTLLLIDQEKAGDSGDMLTFIPTYENLGGFAAAELTDEFEGKEHLIPEAMTPEYSQYYERVYEEAQRKAVDLDRKADFDDFAEELGFDEEQTELLQVRHEFRQSLGANEQFLGNGMTKDNSVDYEGTPFGDVDLNQTYGPVETFTWDKNPQTLLKLEQAGIVTRIPLKTA